MSPSDIKVPLGGPNRNLQTVVTGLAKVDHPLDQAKRLSLFWGYNGRGSSPIQSFENLVRYLWRES